MSLQHQSDLTASLSLIATSSGSVWCVVSHQNEVLLSPTQMKAEAAAQAVQQGVPVLATFEALSPNYNYQAYCYIENEAGIGMSENSDAVVVIVSEETGSISVAIGGMLKRHLMPETLRQLLRNELMPQPEEEPDKPRLSLRELLHAHRKGEQNGNQD